MEIKHAEIAKNLSTLELEQRVFKYGDEYEDEVLKIYKQEWFGRKDRAEIESFKYCLSVKIVFLLT